MAKTLKNSNIEKYYFLIIINLSIKSIYTHKQNVTSLLLDTNQFYWLIALSVKQNICDKNYFVTLSWYLKEVCGEWWAMRYLLCFI